MPFHAIPRSDPSQNMSQSWFFLGPRRGTPQAEGLHPFTSPPTSLSFCLGLVVGVTVFDCFYMVAVVSTMSKYI